MPLKVKHIGKSRLGWDGPTRMYKKGIKNRKDDIPGSLSWNSVSVALPGQVPFFLFFPNWDFINLFFSQKDDKMPGLGLGVGSSSICTWLDVGSATRRKNLSWLSDDVQPQTVRIYRCWDDYRRADIRQLVKNLSAPRWTWIVWTLDQFWKLIICVHIILWWCMWIFWYGICTH